MITLETGQEFTIVGMSSRFITVSGFIIPANYKVKVDHMNACLIPYGRVYMIMRTTDPNMSEIMLIGVNFSPQHLNIGQRKFSISSNNISYIQSFFEGCISIYDENDKLWWQLEGTKGNKTIGTKNQSSQTNRYNDICNKCGAPAYRGFYSFECSKGCK